MGNNIKGITIEIGGNAEPLDKALKGVNSTSRDLQSELREVNKLLKLDPTNTELLNQKQKLLSDSISNTKGKLDTLKEAEKQAQQQFAQGKISEEQYRALQREVVKTEQDLKGLESQARKANGEMSKEDAVDNLKNIGKAAAAVAIGVGAIFVGGLKDAADAETKVAQLEAVLESTGGAAGMTKDQLLELAESFEQNTKFSAEMALEAESLLLTFTNIGSETFPAATQAAADMAAAMGTDMSSQSIALGKALNDPVAGISALTRVGVTFTDEQKALIQSLQESGDMAGAQSVILQELQKEFGGSAEAAGDTLAGKMEILKNTMGAVAEKAATKLVPMILAIIDGLMKLPQWLQDNSNLLIVLGVIIGTITALVIAYNVQQLLAASGMTLWSAVAGIGTTVTTALGAAFTFLTSPISLIIIAIAAVIAIVILLIKNWDWVKEKAAECWEWIKGVWQGAADWFNSKIVQPIANFFGGMWNGIKTGASTLANFISTYVIDPIVAAFKWLYNGVVGIVEGIGNGFVKIINSFIKGVNGVIDTINKFGFSLKYMNTLPAISIPRLATGTVVDKAMLAMLGEDGQEAVVPLEKNLGWVDKIAVNIANKLLPILSGVKMNAAFATSQGAAGIYNNSNQTSNLVLKIEKFINNRSQDTKALMEEMEFYRKQANKGSGSE
ncbi:MAG: phage tail length tape measure family protein [Anaerofustis sp.]